MAITLRTQIAILCTFALTIVPKPAVADEVPLCPTVVFTSTMTA